MRLSILRAALLLGLVGPGARLAAQDARPDTALAGGAAASVTAGAPATAAARPAPDTGDATLRERIERFGARESWFGLPALAAASEGSRVIAAGDTVRGDVAITRGTLEVRGVVTGSAVAYGGDVVVHPGGRVGGDAVAVLGRVRLEGGHVDGEMRAVRGSLATAPAAAPAPSATAMMRSELGLVLGWLTVLVIIGVGVLVFASGPLEGVVETLERGFGRSLLVGMLAELALIPALLLGIVALAITIVGLLLIPFGVVAFVLGAAGLMMLGFLAVARVTGGALMRRATAARLSERGSMLRALVGGIAVFLGLWLVAALLVPVPVAATVVRAVAFALTWVAVTAGFGAAVLSRGGTRRAADVRPEPEPEPDDLSWQTPTPIGGVVAARRPTTTSPR